LTRSCDIAIIGAGTAGLSALSAIRKQTEDFLLINDGPYGTTCARVGCMPSKALIEAANAFHHRLALKQIGVSGADGLAVDVTAVLNRVRDLRDDFVAGVLKVTKDIGKRNIEGRARFVDAQVLEVNGERLQARRIVIATGSRPILPDSWKAVGQRVLTTDDLFEQRTLPKRMAVVGLGGVGAEMAQALSRLGVEVQGFDAAEQLAGITDPLVNQALIEVLRAEFQVCLGAGADLRQTQDNVEVSAGSSRIIVDQVLVALGRRPNVDSLGLETLGVDLDEHGVPPFDPLTMQVGDLPVYIAGDANSRMPLLHEAADDGHIAGYNALRERPECFERRTPLAIVFTDPNVAVVGRSHAELKDGEAVIGEVDFSNQGRARMSDENRGMLRVYVARATGQLLGAEMCAPRGEHLAHLLALAVQRKLTVIELLRMPFYHPVIEEGLRRALRDAVNNLGFTHGGPDLAACTRLGAGAID